MPSNLQDYSTEFLSEEFTKLFATSLFADEIGKWFESASDFVVKFIDNSSNQISNNSDSQILKQISKQIPIFGLKLSEVIWAKQNSQKLELSNLIQSEWNFISPDPGTHEHICIFDWIHEYSSERFPRIIDDEMIHLIFDFFSISTFCRCDFENRDNANLTYHELTRLMLRTTSFEGTVMLRRFKSHRLLEVLDSYRTLDGIKLWNNA